MRSILQLCLLALLVGCYGAADAFLPPGPSYQLTIAGVDPVDPPSVLAGAELRLDLLARDDGELSARVCPRWGQQGTYEIERSDDGVHLVPTDLPALVVASPAAFPPAVASIDRIVLDARLADPFEWTGSFSLEARESGPGDPRSLRAAGLGRVDDVAPEISFHPLELPALPWQPVFMHVSEPVRVADVDRHLPPDVHVDLPPDLSDELLEAMTVVAGRGGVTTWWPPPDIGLRLGAGIPDLAGNASAAVSQSLERVADVELASSPIDFEGSTPVASWGGASGASDPACPSGSGCLAILRAPRGAAGYFARLAGGPSPISRITFAMRAREIGGAGVQPLMVEVEVARDLSDPSGPPTWLTSARIDVPFAAADTGVVTITVELPEPLDAVAFGVRFDDPLGPSPGDRSGPHWGPPLPPLGTLAIVVDDVRVE